MHIQYLKEFRFLFLMVLLTSGFAFAGAADLSSHEAVRVLVEINNIRKRHNLQELITESSASVSAVIHSQELEGRQTLSHWGLDGSRVTERYRAAGGTGLRAGENLGAGDSIDSIIDAWMQSPSHRNNILNPDWFSAGVGHLQTDGGRIILVVVFNNSRWEQTSIRIVGSLVEIEGYVILSPGLFPEKIFFSVDGNDISPIFAALSGSDRIRVHFEISQPAEWESDRIAAIPLFVTESGESHQTDLLFFPPL